MEHIIDCNINRKKLSAVTIGNFDGIHMGHRELINLTKEYAQKENLESIVLTFYPHPKFVFKDKSDFALIMSPLEKKYSIEHMGVDVYIEYPFNKEFASMAPEKFANELIFDKLNCKVLIIGENYKFGYKQGGDYKLLQQLGEKRGVKVIYVPSVMYEDERVSSTRIRKCLKNKDIDKANKLLTTPYFILGEVVEGKRLGRTIGFPTTNIMADNIKLFPPDGVYATITEYNGKLYKSVSNIGCNPTVNDISKRAETYIFDFKKVVYGEILKTYFFKWIRGEQKFPTVDALKEQMERDADSAKKYFLSKEYDFWRNKFNI